MVFLEKFKHFLVKNKKTFSFKMFILVTLFYVLFVICAVYPPTEFVSAGFTIEQVFEGFLGSENVNFVGYHMRRVSAVILAHASLPLGYILTLWCAGEESPWFMAAACLMATIPLIFAYKIVTWWENDHKGHVIVQALRPYVTEGSDWRVVAANINSEFRGVDKVSIPLTATSKFIATETWLLKVTQYKLHIVKQADCSLVTVGSDSHITAQSDEEIQYLNIEVIPSRPEIKRFQFRISTLSLRDLQPRLAQPVRLPENITLLPTLVERFINVFKMHVEQNPVYYVDEVPELCIGCMVSPADVKLTKRCGDPSPLLPTNMQCHQCNCRVLWCTACMARWWAARAPTAASEWLAGRCTCPVCRAVFCMLDVCAARVRTA